MELSLEQLYQQLAEIRSLIENQNQPAQRISPNERMTLLKLSGCQIKTYLIMECEREYAADDIATITGNARAHESGVLNQLARLNLLERRKHGKTVYFRKRS